MKIKIFRPDGETPIPQDNINFHKEIKLGFDEIEKLHGSVELNNVDEHAKLANDLFIELGKKYPLFVEEEFTEHTIKDLYTKYEGPISISFEIDRDTGLEQCIGLVLTHPPGLREDLYEKTIEDNKEETNV